jgi:UDP-N-acetylglucosamine 4-epimerase
MNQRYSLFKDKISKSSFLITGGAGFIGANLVQFLLGLGAKKVRVLDNLSNGSFTNIEGFIGLHNFEFMEGDIRDVETCRKVVAGMDYISHHAAVGSVPRSVEDPVNSNDVNIGGHLNMLVTAKESSTLKRMVYAASSSSFGDSEALPKIEGHEGNPLSPYAVTKWVNELYGDVFSRVYGLHTIGLRYFNIFGPKQNPNNPYAAVIPLFMKAAMEGTFPKINGDGTNSRDFTFVQNVLQANIKAMLDTEGLTKHEVVNIALGDRTNLVELWEAIVAAAGKEVQPVFGPPRAGDIPHSVASIEKAKKLFGYDPQFRLREGIAITYDWFKEVYG